MENQQLQLTQNDFSKVSDRMQQLGLSKDQVMKECSFALQIINKSPQLRKATKESAQSAVLNIAQVGLTLNPVMKLAYLVPRWSKEHGQEVCLEPSYQGLVKLLTDTGTVKAINAQLVREGDDIQVQLSNFQDPIIHKSDPFNNQDKKVIGVYAIALMESGHKQAEIMSLQDVVEIRSRSESYKAFEAGKIKSCVWHSDSGEMMRKSVIRRLVKYLPKSESFEKVALAVKLDEADYGASENAKEFAYNLLQSANIVERIEYAGFEHKIKFANSQEISEIIEELKELQIDTGRKTKTQVSKEAIQAIGHE